MLGGGINQYETDVNVYLDTTRDLYKDLVTVGKDPETGELKLLSQVYRIEKIEQLATLYPEKGHMQNFFYVIVDPTQWGVVLLYNRWKSFW